MHALTLLVPAAAVETVSDRLAEEWGAVSVSVEDADAGSAIEQAVFDEPGVESAARWQRARLAALFADESAAVAAATSVIAAGSDLACHVETIAPVADHDWVRLSQSQFGPIEIEPDFWVVPTWSAPPAGAGKVIRLDPGMAFGTGTHPTTRMCLRWIARTVRARGESWKSVLDYGSGSGVLAIAACLFGAEAVDGVDIDPAAVETTRANAMANGVRVRTKDVSDVSDQYALVLANILSTPLKLLAPLFAARLVADGDLVLSGILDRQAGELREAYAPWLDLVVDDTDDGWILMTGVRRA
ncbi:MAG: 50S ribosomal protein L11 methyltransferase [Pseudomonadota bacterium]|nr:50S ribosomal protein L11 methyltransferase [Pseudomonadota bacterium]